MSVRAVACRSHTAPQQFYHLRHSRTQQHHATVPADQTWRLHRGIRADLWVFPFLQHGERWPAPGGVPSDTFCGSAPRLFCNTPGCLSLVCARVCVYETGRDWRHLDPGGPHGSSDSLLDDLCRLSSWVSALAQPLAMWRQGTHFASLLVHSEGASETTLTLPQTWLGISLMQAEGR